MIGYNVKLRKSVSGFGIVEIMLAVVISMILLTGVIQVYLGSKQSYRMSENMSRLQENARFAIDMLAKDIRMAGFMPCKKNGDLRNSVNGASTNMLLNFFGGALQGYEGGVSVFPDGFPAAGSDPGNRVADSDAIVILRGGNETYNVVSHVATSAQFKVNKPHNFVDGQIAMVCDGEHAAIFQIIQANQSNQTIVHNTGAGSPGNCTKNLGGSGDCDSGGDQLYAYSDESQVVTLESHAYYIGVNSNDASTRSLYRISLLTAGATQTEELLEGVESMQVLYGIDSGGDDVADSYVTADDVAAWDDVVSVRVGLLVHTQEQISPELDNRPYNVAGTVVMPGGAVQHDTDRRIRYAFNSTIKLRNRGIL